MRFIGLNGDGIEEGEGSVWGAQVFCEESGGVEEEATAELCIVGFACATNPRRAQEIALVFATAERNEIGFDRQIAQEEKTLHDVESLGDVFGRDETQRLLEQFASAFFGIGGSGRRFESGANDDVFVFRANRFERDEGAFLERIPAQDAQISGNGLGMRCVFDARIGNAHAERNAFVGGV